MKDSAVSELADALRALREGRPFFSRLLADASLGVNEVHVAGQTRYAVKHGMVTLDDQ